MGNRRSTPRALGKVVEKANRPLKGLFAFGAAEVIIDKLYDSLNFITRQVPPTFSAL